MTNPEKKTFAKIRAFILRRLWENSQIITVFKPIGLFFVNCCKLTNLKKSGFNRHKPLLYVDHQTLSLPNQLTLSDTTFNAICSIENFESNDTNSIENSYSNNEVAKVVRNSNSVQGVIFFERKAQHSAS